MTYLDFSQFANTALNKCAVGVRRRILVASQLEEVMSWQIRFFQLS
jgi:hypothetical protein